MLHQVTCPQCQKIARVPDWLATAQLTCPYCLARIDNVSAKEVFCPRCRFAWHLSYEEPGLELRCPNCNPKISCPHCGIEGESFWLTCPHCEGAFGEKPAQSKRIDSLLVVIRFFGGLALGLAIPFLGLLFGGAPSFAWIPWIVGILLLGLVSIGTTIWQTQENPKQRTPGRFFMSFLLVVGFFVTSSCLLGITYVIYLAVTCNGNTAGSPSSKSKKDSHLKYDPDAKNNEEDDPDGSR
jgi:hypothetical protein